MAIFIPLVTKFDSKGLDGAKRALANFQNFAVDVGRVAARLLLLWVWLLCVRLHSLRLPFTDSGSGRSDC
jgi:hypothetical protein